MNRLLMPVAAIPLCCESLSAQGPAGFALSLDGDGDYVDFKDLLQANFGIVPLKSRSERD